MYTKPAVALAALVSMAILGCETVPQTEAGRESLLIDAEATVKKMVARDPQLQQVIDDAAGYAVFPQVGEGGLIVGAAYGRGIVYEDGQPVGYAELNQGSVGATIGGQTYSELLVFQDQNALARLKAGNFDVGAGATAVALKAGAAATTRFEDGVAVFVLPEGGLMASADVSGQKINYRPMNQSNSPQ